MALSQSLQQKLLQKLSPQQIQLMKLLQVPTANLEERVKEEMEENPALEATEEDHDDGEGELVDEFESDKEEDFEAEGSEDEYDNIDISDYVGEDDDVADYRLKDENYPEIDEKQTLPFKIESTFHESLLEQLSMLNLDEKQRKVAEHIVGSIDDDGYLRRDSGAIADDLAFRQNIAATEEEIALLVKQIQRFDPPGICARDLRRPGSGYYDQYTFGLF